MLNLAGCYESQQLFAKAIIWYEFALCVRPEADDAHFGISVCALKSGDPSRALANADIALKLCCAQAGGEALLREEKIHLTYMRAVALKSLRRFKEAQVAYTGMVRSFSRQEGLKIAKYIFGMILMPLETNRKKIMQYVEGF
jgi:tetratricopeptide (TPR) repeat protein